MVLMATILCGVGGASFMWCWWRQVDCSVLRAAQRRHSGAKSGIGSNDLWATLLRGNTVALLRYVVPRTRLRTPIRSFITW